MCLISCMQKSYGKGYGIAITLAKPLPSLLSRHPLPTPINSHWPLYQAPPLSYHSIFTHPFAIYGIGGNAKLWHRTHVEQFYRKKPPPPGGFLCRRGSKSRTRRKKTPQEEKPPKFKVDQFWGVVLVGGVPNPEPGGRRPPKKKNPQNSKLINFGGLFFRGGPLLPFEFWGLFFRGGPLLLGSWFGNHPTKKSDWFWGLSNGKKKSHCLEKNLWLKCMWKTPL